MSPAEQEQHVTLPDLTADQRRAALDAAVAARHRRAEVKAAVARGALSIGEVLQAAEHDEAVAKIRVSVLLECLPGIGPVRAGQVLAELGIAPSRRLRGLGVHQVARLSDRFAAVAR
ncbi:integration host factor, actinobacterial type [Kytococcus schroeteri]|uniref:integration host factor, actinobacterial type n=1 Tax=Kytococcus schroeteri TaxID=138300 RepID=UPI00406BB6EF